jgi:hypothetical protein
LFININRNPKSKISNPKEIPILPKRRILVMVRVRMPVLEKGNGKGKTGILSPKFKIQRKFTFTIGFESFLVF